MALVSMNQMLFKAVRGLYAVGQFNLNSFEFTQAILQAAEAEKAPVILGLNEAYLPYMGGLSTIAAIVKELIEHYGTTVPVALHLDHGSTFEVCRKAIDSGFTSVMIDGFHHSLDYNIEQTKRVVEYAHARGASVEAGLGRTVGREDDINVDEAKAMYALTEECIRMARETNIDALAPALGSVHGPYGGEPRIAFERMNEIRKITGLPLALHGGSGLPDDIIQKAIILGTAKINVSTDNQLVFTAKVREHLKANKEDYDPRRYLSPARDALQQGVQAKMRQFGSSGKAK
ncbi:class II fructose-1,6-bisphosphate aldolase [Paenibacillus sp. LjRoot56]|uniref:class II fructose-1,6-bisphosphate aldolase n=1 Tax=Paenibacillus sp. LjRoot56 TaxID=3342333 RepID=UPI003ED0554D